MPQSKRDLRKIQKKCPYFRVLIIGRANAGKTTILKKICNTTENLEVRGQHGFRMGLSSLLPPKQVPADEPSAGRGNHDIEKELVFPNTPGFIFHDSRGFESGGTEELDRVKKFISERSKEKKLKNKLHVVWYCLATDSSRLLTAAETSFFDKCGTGKVPVIALFTKFDHGDIAAFRTLEAEGLDFDEARREAPRRSLSDFESAHLPRVSEKRFPPRSHVYLRDMNKPESNCGDLVERTADALNDDILRRLFVSSQKDNLGVCIKYAVRDGIVSALQKVKGLDSMQSDEAESAFSFCMSELISEILCWFPNNPENLQLRRRALDLAFDFRLGSSGGRALRRVWRFGHGLQQETDSIIESLLLLAGPSSAVHQILRLGMGVTIIAEYSYSLPQQNRLSRSLAFYQASSAMEAVNRAAEALDLEQLDLEQCGSAIYNQLFSIVDKNLLSHN